MSMIQSGGTNSFADVAQSRVGEAVHTKLAQMDFCGSAAQGKPDCNLSQDRAPAQDLTLELEPASADLRQREKYDSNTVFKISTN
jgi:hypothetical protein